MISGRLAPLRELTRENDALKAFFRQKATAVYVVFLLIVLLLAAFGPYIVPYDFDERQRGADGQLLRGEPPSVAHPLGTTNGGYDVLSRLIFGARPTAIAGMLGGVMIISIGLSIGLLSGYVGGRVDTVLMRFTDVAYGVPLIPAALVLVAIFGIGFYQSVVVIGLLLWRGSARVIRSQVLQIKERSFILSLQALGASPPYIILRHILPNVAPMAVLFFALGTGYTIVIQAGLAFLGVADPFTPTWGVMIRNTFDAGLVGDAWWWSLPPGFAISFTVLSLFMLGRGYEEINEDASDEALVEAT